MFKVGRRILQRQAGLLRSNVAAPAKSIFWDAERGFRTSLPSLGTVQFKLADIGEGIAEVELMQWFVKEGDAIEQFQNLCEVQSDKATVEITSRYDGVVTKVHYEVGDLAKVGLPLVDIEVEGDVEEAPAPTPTAPKVEREPVAAPTPSVVVEQAPQIVHDAPVHARKPGDKLLATPAVRRLAKEHGVNLAEVPGTAKAGRISKGDLLLFIQNKGSHAVQSADSSRAAEPTPASVETGEIPPKRDVSIVRGADEDVPIRGIQRMMVQSMKESLQIPHFGYYDEVDMTALMETRKLLNDVGQKDGVKITYMPIMMKAASMALAEFPALNSFVSADETTQTIKSDHNIGLAMDTPRGLLVPIVKNCEQRSVFDIAYEINRLQAMGSQNKLGGEELTGGTFTLSNIGSIGGTYASPVILAPQVAIGALGKIRRVPRFDAEDNVYAANMMSVSWSADHRVIDGATMARFSNLWKDYLENPEKMLVHLK